MLTFFVAGNSLTGPIPSTFGLLLEMVELELSDNLLTSNLPTELGTMGNLEVLRLGMYTC